MSNAKELALVPVNNDDSSSTGRERVKPIRVTVNRLQKTFTLEFNRASVKFVESREFDVSAVPKFPATMLPELFYYAFRMHHREMSREQTNRILEEDLRGLPTKAIARLVDLYNQARYENVVRLDDEEDGEKNAGATLEMD